MSGPVVMAVSRNCAHAFSKPNCEAIRLRAGLGIEGDAHMGVLARHQSRVARDPSQPNLRQVHLIHSELFAELRLRGFAVAPGELGENVTTEGLDLLGLPRGARLHLGATAVVALTGLRSPCHQVNEFQSGLVKELVFKDDHGNIIRKVGVMGIVLADGEVRAGDAIEVELPVAPHQPLECI